MRFLNHVVNPVVRVLLRSPLHGLLSSSLALLTYTGRRTGRRRTIPVMYARAGDSVVVLAGHPERKRWWRNLRRPAPVELRLRGRVYRGRGRLAVAGTETERALALYLARFPRAAKALGVTTDGDGRPEPSALARAAAIARVVLIELAGESGHATPLDGRERET